MPGFDWFAQLPEITTGKLQAGPQAAPMVAAAAAYGAQAAAFGAQAAAMTAAIAEAASHWEGLASFKSTAAALKMPVWLMDAAVTAAEHGARATAQAASYETAFVSVPQLPEIAENHVTRAVLHATNFFNVNAVPIAIKEADYWIRMRTQAGNVMLGYLGDTAANVATLKPPMPPLPIAIPGAGMAAVGKSGMLAITGSPEAAGRDATLALNTAQAMASSARLVTANLAAFGNDVERKVEQGVATGTFLGAGQQQDLHPKEAQDAAQATQMVPQMASQLVSQAGQAPQQLLQAPQQFMQLPQQFMSPMQQFSQLFSGGFGKDATGADVTQVGLFGTHPESNHPAAGGSGAPVGAGMLSGGGVPGNPGASARTPLLASVTAAPAAATATPVTATPAAAADANAVRAGAAPMGMMPMSGAHGRKGSGGTVDELVAPSPLAFDNDDDDVDDWG